MDDDASSSAAASRGPLEEEDDDDDDDYEDLGGGNRLLGFMFGNVDGSGDLDVDYLDEDAKEHLAALADKLGPSLTDIDLSRSSPGPTDASELDYDEKAEDAVDYEDIDEQYDGPEIQDITEEDHLLPKKQYFAANVSVSSLNHKSSIFDEENYDEEEIVKESRLAEDKCQAQSTSSPGEQLAITSIKDSVVDDILAPVNDILPPADGNLFSSGSPEGEHISFESEDIQEEPAVVHGQFDSRNETSLPILCIEDGMVILRFSEIFGIHEPVKKADNKTRNRNYLSREWAGPLDIDDIAEEDDEAFLRTSFHDLSNTRHLTSAFDNVDDDLEQETSGFGGQIQDLCICAQPMKESMNRDSCLGQYSQSCPKFYPLDQRDWEDEIIWGNSPPASHGFSESCVSEHDSTSEDDIGAYVNAETAVRNIESAEKGFTLLPPSLDRFGSSKVLVPETSRSSERSHDDQLLRLESRSEMDLYSAEMKSENGTGEFSKGDAIRRFSKLSLQNKDLLEGSWLDEIIWDPDKATPKPKLILDFQDEQMLFEVLDHKDGEHLCSHAGAMVIVHSSKTSMGESFDLPNQGMLSIGRFNISNDKYYSNRKTSQQAKSHAKKRAFMGIKVMHSVPALKLQTMKPKLSNKDIANFHRPKAVWYPHANEVAAKAQGTLCAHGPMKVILLSLGGKGIKLHVDAEEMLYSVKLKASKKLDFRSSEKVKLYYCAKELEDDKSLFMQNVRPNSVLHLVRTKIHLWPKAQRLPGENKPVRPPGAFKKKSDLSVKDGHVFLMEYCEERPLLLGNVGMGARLCTYYQKVAPGDQTASSLRNGNSSLGNVLTLDPADKSPFLGDIGPGCSQSCLETNMYRAPIFQHKLSSTDYLLVRSAKGTLSLRRIDKLYVVGQQEPHMEVLSPGAKNVQTYLVNRMLVYVYREFRARENPGFLPSIRADELAAQFPGLTDAFIRKRLKHCADLKRGLNGVLVWVKRRDFRVPTEEELRRMLAPENVCSYESMQAGLYRLKRLGISKLTHPVGLSSAMNQLPDEAIALAAASHIERELQITSWNLCSNFVACTNQDRENIERLEITGVGDPSGRGLGFSYVRVTPKAPISSAMVKKKAAAARGGSSVTGTDADLRRLSMDAAREVLLKFKIPEEQIEKLTRWHRIAMVRKLSSEQAASGVKVDATTLNKFARGQRMSFLQLQQQTREKCQEIWDRQAQSLSAAGGDENESDTEANSDLDSFAGDLENLLDAEEFDEEDDGYAGSKADKMDGVRGLKMRRCPSQAKTEEEMEDDEAEAALIHKLLEDDEAELKKKKNKPSGTETGYGSQLASENAELAKKTNTMVRQNISTPILERSVSSKEIMMRNQTVVEKCVGERDLSGKVKFQKGFVKNDDVSVGMVKKKSTLAKDGLKVIKEKKQIDKPVRESFVCGACGQLGHMRTNKNCPKYGEDMETPEIESVSGKSHPPDAATQLQLKTPSKKLTPKVSAKVLEAEVLGGSAKIGSKSQAKVLPLKLKCGLPDQSSDKNLLGSQVSDKPIVANADMDARSTVKISKIKISSKSKSHGIQREMQKPPAIKIQPPVEKSKEQPCKKITFKQPKGSSNVDQVTHAVDIGMDHEFRKTKKIVELTSFEKQRKQESQWFVDEVNRNTIIERKQWDKEEKRSRERFADNRRMLEEERRMTEKNCRLLEPTRYEAIRKEELQKTKKKKKKKKKPDFGEEYLVPRSYRNDRRLRERDRAAKRRPIVDLGMSEYAPLTKRRRGGEVLLSNILESIVESLKESIDISYLFLKPVTKKEAPDYLDIIEQPMDLSTIRDKVRNMEYKSREDFRHDVWQITYNAHKYNDGRNPTIPPLADQLLELCDYHLDQKHELLSGAEEGI